MADESTDGPGAVGDFATQPPANGSPRSAGSVVTVAGDEVYDRWFTKHDATAALQRPDFHLYGTASSPAGAAALIEHLPTRLANQPARQGALL